METTRYKTALRTVKLLNVILLTIPFAFSWYGVYAGKLADPLHEKENWLILFLFAVLYIAYGRLYDGFKISLSRISELIGSQILAVVIADGILYVVTALLFKGIPPILPMVGTFAAQILLSVLWCKLAHRWYFNVFEAKKTAVIYDMREGMERLISQYGLSNKFDVVKTASVTEALEENLEILKNVKVVFLCGVHSHERNIILKYCIAHGIQMYLIPRIGDVLMSGATRMHMFHLPMLKVGRYSPTPEYLFFKRALDIAVSGLAFIVLSPVMAIVAVAIKLTDHGPVLYRQCRLTKDGKKFDVMKFRSMRVDAEKDGVARLSSGDHDDRITTVGHFIRKCRLDELPQLLNILRGDMSIVGPRPERPEIAAQYEEELPEFALRLQAKAGLTGYAQVYGKYNTTPYDKLQMDLMYISNPNIIEDIKIMFATVKILFESESTEGIAEGTITAAEFGAKK